MDIDKAARRIRLKDLHMLTAVVRAGGIRKAAQALHLSQPAVSRAILGLEETLGYELLQRGPEGIVPTQFGVALVRRARNLTDELHGALMELEHLADPSAGEVRLACGETLHAGVVSACMGQILHSLPRMHVSVESGQANDLIEHFLQPRLVDFVVTRPVTLPLPDDIEGEPLFHDRMRVVVGHNSPYARRRKLRLDEVSDAHWILSRNELMPGSPLVEAFHRASAPMPTRIVASGSLHTRYSLLPGGRFVTLMPHSLFPFVEHGAAIKVLPIDLPRWETPTMILTVKHRTIGPAALLFLDRLRKLAGTLDE